VLSKKNKKKEEVLKEGNSKDKDRLSSVKKQ